jgi:hypothetical protein
LSGYEEALNDYDEKMAGRAQKGILDCLLHTGNWNRILDYLSQWSLPAEESYRYRIRALTGLKRTDEAFTLCNDWLRSSPGNIKALWFLVDLEILQNGLESTLSKYERLAKIPSKPPIYGEIYASLCKKTGKVDKAVSQYQKLQTRTSDPRILRNKAYTLAKSGHELDAIPLLEELLRAAPTDVYLHKSYASACSRINNLQRAQNFYHELLNLNPDEKSLYGRIKKIQNQLTHIPDNSKHCNMNDAVEDKEFPV